LIWKWNNSFFVKALLHMGMGAKLSEVDFWQFTALSPMP